MDFLSSGILDVLIGLALVYLLMATAASLLQELIVARLRKTRASALRDGILQMWRHPEATEAEVKEFVDAVYAHPLIKSLSRPKLRPIRGRARPGSTNPAYIPSKAFVRAVLDVTEKGVAAAKDVEAALDPDSKDALTARAKKAKVAIHSAATANNVLTAVTGTDVLSIAKYEAADIEKRIESWFDASMERVQGVWTGHTQRCLLGIAIVFAVTFNIDSVAITHSLMNDDVVRAKLVGVAEQKVAEGERAEQAAKAAEAAKATAEETAKKDPANAIANEAATKATNTAVNASAAKAGAEKAARTAISDVRSLGLPLGWTLDDSTSLASDSRRFPGKDVTDWLTKLMGIAITAAAVSFGAPFWFDLLKRLVSIRGSGPAIPLARDDPKKDA